jgi:hypothetical protein
MHPVDALEEIEIVFDTLNGGFVENVSIERHAEPLLGMRTAFRGTRVYLTAEVSALAPRLRLAHTAIPP